MSIHKPVPGRDNENTLMAKMQPQSRENNNRALAAGGNAGNGFSWQTSSVYHIPCDFLLLRLTIPLNAQVCCQHLDSCDGRCQQKLAGLLEEVARSGVTTSTWFFPVQTQLRPSPPACSRLVLWIYSFTQQKCGVPSPDSSWTRC